MEEFLNNIHTAEHQPEQASRCISDTTVLSVLGMKCFSLKDLQAIANKLELSTYKHDRLSFKMSYRSLGIAIHKEYNISFGMVEGLHRIYTVKNALEGRFLTDPNQEPTVRNIFLEKLVKVRLHISDNFTDETINQFSELSLMYMKVKGASVQRTLFDELTQIVNEIQSRADVVNLKNCCELFSQLGRHSKDGSHILYNQRLLIYSYITSFALNDKKSTILYKFQDDHILQVLSSQHIPNKHQYLGVDDSTNLYNEELFMIVSRVIMSNVSSKAEEYTTLYTKNNSRNNDLTMKPLAGELRIVLSYYVMASIDMNSIEESTRIFSTNYMFKETQVQNNIEIVTTMYNIVHSIDSVVTMYRKLTEISANEIHATKLEQLLHMNLFQDVLEVIKSIGHNPTISVEAIGKLYCTIDEDVKQSVLVELLQAWNIQMSNYLKKEKNEVLSEWKEDLMSVCRGEHNTKTDVKLGKFSATDLSAYTVNEKILFSFFFKQVVNNSLNVYDVPEKEAATKPTWQDIAADYVMAPLLDDEAGAKDEEERTVAHANSSPPKVLNDSSKKTSNKTNPSIEQSPNKSKSPNSKRLAPLFDQQSNKKRTTNENERDTSLVKTSNKKKTKIDKKMFEIPEAVLTIYTTAITWEERDVPVNRDMEMIRQAWMSTVDSLNVAADLKNLWEIHKSFLFQQRQENCMASSVTDNRSVTLNAVTSNTKAPSSTPSSVTFDK